MKKYYFIFAAPLVFFLWFSDAGAGLTAFYAPVTFNSKDCSSQPTSVDGRAFIFSQFEAADRGWTNFYSCMGNLGYYRHSLGKDGEYPEEIYKFTAPATREAYAYSGPKEFISVTKCQFIRGSSCQALAPVATWSKKQVFSLNYLPSTISSSVSIPAPISYSVAVGKTGTGNGLISSTGIHCGSDCSDSYTRGTKITLTPLPSVNSVFSGWEGGDCAGNRVCVLAVNGNKSAVARFDLKTFSLNVNKIGSGRGTVIGNGINCGADCLETYPIGTTVILSARPASGSVFEGWSGSCSGTNSCVVNLSSNRVISARFNVIGSLPEWIRGILPF